MKRIIKLVLIIMLLPITVFADMGIPAIQEYEASIINEEGTECEYYDSSTKKTLTTILPYDTKVKVIYETKDKSNIQYNEINCDISNKDISPIEKEYKVENHLNEVKKADGTGKIKALNKNGIHLYSGPSSTYEKKLTIPFNTALEYSYSSGQDNGTPLWLYTEYNGVKGWVCVLNGDVGIYQNDNLDILLETEIYDSVYSNSGKQIGKIETFTTLKEYYSLTSSLKGIMYVEYNDIKGYISIPYVKNRYNETIKIDKKVYMYKTLDSTEFIQEIPENIEIKYNYVIYDYGTNYYYLTYNGKSGWITITNDSDIELTDTTTTTEVITTSTTSNVTTKIVKQESKKISSSEFIVMCIFGALIVSLTGLVVIILVNKKKKDIFENKNTQIKNDLNK